MEGIKTRGSALLCLVLVLFLGSCQQKQQPQAVSADLDQNTIAEFVKLAGQPSSDHELILIDGATNKAYAIEVNSGISASSVGGQAYFARLTDDVVYGETKENREQESDFETLAASCPRASTGPYYKSTFQGATGFSFDATIPPSSNYTGQSHYMYGGYQSGATGVEVGFQHDLEANTQWQLFFNIRKNYLEASEKYDWQYTKGFHWKMASKFYNPGTTISLKSETKIGSDSKHYIFADAKQGSTTVSIGFVQVSTPPQLS
jgi:hypothetical protein